MRQIQVQFGTDSRMGVVCCLGITVHRRLDHPAVGVVLHGDILQNEAVGADNLKHEFVVVPQLVGGVLEGLWAFARSQHHEGLVCPQVILGALHNLALAEGARSKDEVLVTPQLVAGACESCAVDLNGLHHKVAVVLQRGVSLKHVISIVFNGLEHQHLVLAEFTWRPLENLAPAGRHASEEEVSIGQDLLWCILELGPVAEDHGAPDCVAVALQGDLRGGGLLHLGWRQDAVPLSGLEDCVHDDGDASEA
mmetsp:Transcript_90757/g.282737  ORF Transcript_90757/g.282737 Transcript_90757/m.282737 type:complete len:251 (+) Transcript_90757:1070-1822(+)